MVNDIKKKKITFVNFFPIILLFLVALNGNSVMNLKFVSINMHYIIVYYWVLRKPQNFGYGNIFLAGIISDVVFGLPLGVNSLSLLIIAATATYIRLVTVRITLLNDWISFIIALLFGNIVYFLSLYYSNLSIDYLYLFQNSVFTFIFYPILWIIFSLFIKITNY